MSDQESKGTRPAPGEPSSLRLVAMAFTPWALPRPMPLTRAMSRAERRAAKRANQAFIHSHLGTYLDRGGRMLVALTGIYLAGIWVLGSPWVAAVAGVGLLGNLAHLVCVAFWKQHLDDLFGCNRGE